MFAAMEGPSLVVGELSYSTPKSRPSLASAPCFPPAFEVVAVRLLSGLLLRARIASLPLLKLLRSDCCQAFSCIWALLLSFFRTCRVQPAVCPLVRHSNSRRLGLCLSHLRCHYLRKQYDGHMYTRWTQCWAVHGLAIGRNRGLMHKCWSLNLFMRYPFSYSNLLFLGLCLLLLRWHRLRNSMVSCGRRLFLGLCLLLLRWHRLRTVWCPVQEGGVSVGLGLAAQWAGIYVSFHLMSAV